MATTGYATSDFASGFKEVIQSYIQDNLPKSSKLVQVMKSNDGVEYEAMNNEFKVVIRTGRHSGVVNLASELAKLRTGSAGITRGTVSAKILTATFDIGDLVKKASQGDKKAVVNAAQFQGEAMKNDFSRNINRQYASDGVGVLAQVSGSVGAGTLSVMYPDSNLDDGRSTHWYGQINADIKPTKYFAVGQAIGIGTAGADVGTITAVTGDGTLGTLVVTGAPAIAANDAIYLVDGDETGAGTAEVQGYAAALGTQTYAGITRATETWTPQTLGTAANAALTIADMDTVYVSALEYAEQGDRYAWFMNRSLWSKYGELLTSLRRTVNKTELVSGWSGLEFQAGEGNVGVFLDYDIRDGEAVLLNLDTWTICQVADMGFVGDNMMRRSDYITFQNVFSWYTNNFCKAPAANGRMFRRTR